MTACMAYQAFREELLDLYRPPLRERKTWDRMNRVSGILGELGPVTTADLTVPLFRRYVELRKTEVRVNTVIGELSYLRAACAYACQCGYLERNPFDHGRLRIRREPPKGTSHHSISEVRRVLLFLGSRKVVGFEHRRLHALACTVAYTGLRASEAYYLQREDVNLEDRILIVSGRRRLKTDLSAAPVPMAGELVEVLSEWLGSHTSKWCFPAMRGQGPWTSGRVGVRPVDKLKAAAAAVGVDGMTFQTLRHSWATHGETRWGLSREEIKRVLRHTNPFTSQLYYCHADVPNLQRIGDRVSYLDATR